MSRPHIAPSDLVNHTVTGATASWHYYPDSLTDPEPRLGKVWLDINQMGSVQFRAFNGMEMVIADPVAPYTIEGIGSLIVAEVDEDFPVAPHLGKKIDRVHLVEERSTNSGRWFETGISLHFGSSRVHFLDIGDDLLVTEGLLSSPLPGRLRELPWNGAPSATVM
ncbi:hypothetical protein GCM10009613_23250 [Pseudonocardia kongjuensis]|uniref:Dioxygenase n=1 Tax=Pseudonocardia kongjuensis TaxID=102227 RepID=A0ABN1XQQ6_9PSEU